MYIKEVYIHIPLYSLCNIQSNIYTLTFTVCCMNIKCVNKVPTKILKVLYAYKVYTYMLYT